MTLALVPIPPTHVEETWPHLKPYVLKIAERGKTDPQVIADMLNTGSAQAFLVWDDEAKKSLAFIGVEYERRGADLIGKIVWLMGENRALWVHLFDDLKAYLQRHQQCVGIKVIARLGWVKHLKALDMRQTHVVFEKDF